MLEYINQRFLEVIETGDAPARLTPYDTVYLIYVGRVLRPLLRTEPMNSAALDDELQFIRVALEYGGPERATALDVMRDYLWQKLDVEDVRKLEGIDQELCQRLRGLFGGS